MSGQHGARGYLLQALVCVLDSLDDDSWASVTIEPNDESQKVDIVWAYVDSQRKKVQVKHSTKPIGLADAKRWAKELEESVTADQYELRLLGNCKDGLPPADGLLGRVAVPLPAVINFDALRKHGAQSLDVYLTRRDDRRSLRPKVREMVVDALSNRVGTMSTEGEPLTRNGLDKLLDSWIDEILLEAGCATVSTHTEQRRFELLEQLLTRCEGRQIAGWQAAGIPRETATRLAKDESLGALPDELLPTDDSPLRLLVAPLGMGKTLAVYRYIESCVRAAMHDKSARIPVILEAPLIDAGLEQAVRDASGGIGDPNVNAVSLVVDRLDELSARDALQFLGEARVLVNAWRGAHVILTSRQMRCWEFAEEKVNLQPLDEDASLRLIAMTSQWKLEDLERASWGWTNSLKETIRTPLFAILFGRYLHHGQAVSRASRAALVAHLVEPLMCRNESAATDSAQAACRDLATMCLDRGGAVPSTELEPRSIHDALLRTGVVVETEGLLSFTLPTVMQWFDSLAITAGEIELDSLWEYPSRIDRWRAALAIAVGTGTADSAERILTNIAKRDPGFLPTVVEEATSHWSLDAGVQPPNAIEAAQRLRAAMEACKTGIGILAAVITPIDPRDGSLFATGSRTEGEWVIAGWSTDESHEKITTLPPHITLPGPWMTGDKMLPGPEETLSFSQGAVPPCWFFVRGARPGRQPAWAWRWVSEQLREVLKERLKPSSMFDYCARPLVTEAAWEPTLDLLHYRRDHAEPIPIQAIAEALPLTMDELIARSRGMQRTILRENWREIELTALGAELGRLQELQIKELSPLLPTPDLSPEDDSRHWYWLRYSEAQFVTRITTVLQLALEAYLAIVHEWFKPFESRLHRAVTLPARIVAVVDSNSREPGFESEPWAEFRWEPLPEGRQSEVVAETRAVHLGEFDLEIGRRIMKDLARFRPDSSESIGIIRSTQRICDLFSGRAVRTITFQWLENDLSRIGWLGR